MLAGCKNGTNLLYHLVKYGGDCGSGASCRQKGRVCYRQQYCFYSVVQKWVFRPARAPIHVEFGKGERTPPCQRSLMPNFTFIGAEIQPQNCQRPSYQIQTFCDLQFLNLQPALNQTKYDTLLCRWHGYNINKIVLHSTHC